MQGIEQVHDKRALALLARGGILRDLIDAWCIGLVEDCQRKRRGQRN